MILYIENPKESTKKLLEVINEFSKVAGYKINIQNPIEFLYICIEKPKSKIKKTIPFTIVSKTRNKLTKEMQNLYSEVDSKFIRNSKATSYS